MLLSDYGRTIVTFTDGQQGGTSLRHSLRVPSEAQESKAREGGRCCSCKGENNPSGYTEVIPATSI